MKLYYKSNRGLYFSALLIIIIGLVSCKKFAEVDAPYTSTNAGTVYADDARAIAVLTGLYTRMSSGSVFTGVNGISLCAGLSSDEFTLYKDVNDTRLIAFYQNALMGNLSSSVGSEFWAPLYNYIFTCNAAIEGIEGSSSLTENNRVQLLGEAKFLRAFCYFYLVTLFGDVPLVINTDYKASSLLGRSSSAKIYDQIISDLKEAQNLLSSEYLNGSLLPVNADRVRPNKWAATALLARTYLYIGDWVGAEQEASSVINKSNLYDTTTLNNVFLKNSKEAIWQLQPVSSGRNTEEAQMFILTSSGPTTNATRPVFLSSQILNAIDPLDKRKTKWIDSVIAAGSGIKYFFPSKYKNLGANVTEYLMVLRLGEQYLIRAEARANLDKISDAQNDLNLIRRRAGLNNINSSDKPSLLKDIINERQIELFSEMGHRWFDLKRSKNIDQTMSVVTPVKANGSIWQPYQQLYPIPWSEIQKAPNLTQNGGY